MSWTKPSTEPHYQQTVAALATGVEDLRTRVGALPGALDAVAMPPGAARDALDWCIDELVHLGTAMLDVFEEMLRARARRCGFSTSQPGEPRCGARPPTSSGP
jgi:hypothetical protein